MFCTPSEQKAKTRTKEKTKEIFFLHHCISIKTKKSFLKKE
jgi:hypothetical protein